MSIDLLRNKAAKDITLTDFETAIEELKSINNTINVIGYNDIDGILHINFEVVVETGGYITENLRMGKFISLIETGVSSVEREKIMAKIRAVEAEDRKKAEKRSESAKKSAKTRAAKKPENNIEFNGEKISFSLMIDDLVSLHTDRSYDSRFIKDIMSKKKLTAKQHNYLCKVAEKHGYSMPEKVVRASKKAESRSCEHEDLGSLGYTHGTTVKCPNCGIMAEVW